jgi:hypothetical protein
MGSLGWPGKAPSLAVSISDPRGQERRLTHLERLRNLARCKQIWDIDDPNDALPTGMKWPDEESVDDETVDNLRKLAETCASMSLATSVLKRARSERLKKYKSKKDSSHTMRAHQILARDVRMAIRALQDLTTVMTVEAAVSIRAFMFCNNLTHHE